MAGGAGAWCYSPSCTCRWCPRDSPCQRVLGLSLRRAPRRSVAVVQWRSSGWACAPLTRVVQQSSWELAERENPPPSSLLCPLLAPRSFSSDQRVLAAPAVRSDHGRRHQLGSQCQTEPNAVGGSEQLQPFPSIPGVSVASAAGDRGVSAPPSRSDGGLLVHLDSRAPGEPCACCQHPAWFCEVKRGRRPRSTSWSKPRLVDAARGELKGVGSC